jgi:tripartite-type tricarboxylate transporter receptor subunit TctC
MPRFSIYQIIAGPARLDAVLQEGDDMMTKRRFVSLTFAGSLAALLPEAVRAETISRMLVGFGAGGAIDVIARMLVEGMKGPSSSLIVDNRPGAGGRIALGLLKGSPADGTAMILTPASCVAVFPHVYKSLGYDALKDFIPVTAVCSFPFLLTVGPMVPVEVKTLADFVEWCRANPKQATYGTAAAGSMLHFTGVSLAKAGGFEFVHLPYGGPGGIQDLIGGRIAATIYPIGTALPHVQSGAIRALATTGPQRSPQLINVPTVREAGYPMLEVSEWFGVFVPANTPAGTVNHLNDTIRMVVNTDSFKAGLAKLSVDSVGDTPQEFAQRARFDFDRWGPIVRASGFTPED